MALKKKNKAKAASRQAKNTGENYFTLSTDKKKKILGLFLIVIPVLLLFSILSYSKYDDALLSGSVFSDIGNIVSGDQEFHDKIQDTRNWLGIIGAHISSFFVNSTIGYSSVVFPVIMFLWGFSLFSKINFRTLIHTSNFLLIGGILLSAFFGVFRSHYGWFSEQMGFYGGVGYYLGEVSGNLLGGIGSLAFITAAMVVLLIIAFDIKIEKIFHFLRDVFSSSVNKVKDEYKNAGIEKEDSNLVKIKGLREEKKKKEKETEKASSGKGAAVTKDEAPADEVTQAGQPTRIRIIRKSDEPLLPEKNAVRDEEIKKVNLEKVGEVGEKEFDREREAALPNQWEEKIKYHKPGFDLLELSPEENFKVAEEELKHNAELLKEKLKLFDIDIQDISVTPGPVVTLYEIVPAPGVKISKIVGLENDIALALAARGIRIIAPIPGKSAIGVEIPNAEASMVNARSVLGKIGESKAELPLSLGKTINGDVYITDLAKMPHLLIAGSTGSGKSVGINMIVSSLLYSKHPSEVKLIMIDPKKIELSFYNKLRKHYLAVSPDLDEEIITNPQNAVLLLKCVEYEMEKRYDKLAKAGVRNIVDYNIKVKDPVKKPKDTEDIIHHPIPYLVVVIDELADLMITAGKEVEEPIARLAQLARAVGIHLVLATQRPSVNVITGVIKANFSARIAYQVATKIDSRTILDMNGAEQLLGKGDMLFLPTGSPKPIRIQNAFISTDEVERITDYIQKQQGYSKPYFLPSLYDKKKSAGGGTIADLDPMFEEAARVIVRHQQGSVSLLQRRLKLGYSRAARIVDQLEEAGIVGPNDGSKAREVIVENEEQLETILRNI
jgi:S-DNA-T family DNA segregation ATPase FtsK/SpoIIIE